MEISLVFDSTSFHATGLHGSCELGSNIYITQDESQAIKLISSIDKGNLIACRKRLSSYS